MGIGAAHVDAALATKGGGPPADLARDVHNQVLLACIDCADQAPTGDNLGSRGAIVVRDRP